MRRDKITAAAFAAAAVLMFSGCAGRQEETAAETAAETEAETEAVESSGEAEAESAKESGSEELVIYDDTEQADDDLTFDDLKNIQFVFSSGAGGWSTLLDIRPDGSFEGEYFDSDMGSTGEGYPNGTVYLCDFKGQFTEPEKIDEHTYAVKIASMEYKQEAGTREIKDSILYEYTDVYGLDGADRTGFSFICRERLWNLCQRSSEAGLDTTTCRRRRKQNYPSMCWTMKRSS